MIPIRDVIPSRTTPYVTTTLIVLNVLVFLRMPPTDSAAFDCLRAWGVSAGQLRVVHDRDGDVRARRIRAPRKNMLFLWIFGDNVEDRMGHGRYLLFYGICGAAAALLQVFLRPARGCRWSAPAAPSPACFGAYLCCFRNRAC